MRKKRAVVLMASVMAVGVIGTSARAQTVTLLSDSLTSTNGQTGNLAGTVGDTVPSGETWVSYYANNDAAISPATGTLSFAGSFGAVTGGSGISPGTPTRGATGTAFTDTDTHTNDGAYIGLTTGITAPITETATITLTSNSTTDGTAWGFIGLLNTDPGAISAADTPPDVVANGAEETAMSAWLLIRANLAGGDYAELYATGGTGKQASTLTTIPAADGGVWGLTHTLSMTVDPVAGTLDATIDGTTLLSTPYSFSSNGLSTPTIDGVILGDRTNSPGSSGGNATGVSATDPSDVVISNLGVTGAAPPLPTWTVSTSGDWNVATNWGGKVPNAAGAEADFFGGISSPETVYTNAADTVGTMHFNNASEYLITGAGNLTISAKAGNSGLIEVDQGTDNIDLPITFASNSSLNVAGGATLIFGNPVTVNSGVAVTHTGTGTITYQSLVDVLYGGSLSMENATFAGTLSLESGAGASLTANTGSVVKVSGLNIASGGTMDINNNTLVVNYGSGGDPVANIRSLLASGYNGNGGKWQGAGITSSLAAADPGHYSVGYADGGNATDAANTGVAAGEVEVKYTVAGDINLDGSVDLSDLVIVASDFGQSGADWAAGDVNYDGQVDLSDLVILAGNFGSSLNSVAASSFSASFAAEWQLAQAEIHGADVSVPEPGIVSLALVGTAGLLARRRKAK